MDNELVEAVALEPCPFCGSSEVELYVGSRNIIIRCELCPVDMGVFETEAEAIAAWNTRTPLASLKAENEALRSALTAYSCGRGCSYRKGKFLMPDGRCPREHEGGCGKIAYAALTKQGG